MAKLLPAGARALEIGSHIGSSALFICAGLKHLGGHLYCVDTWMNETMPDGEHDTYREFLENTRGASSMITPIRKLSGDLRSEDISGPLDFVFIDGDHSEQAVRTDFRTVADWVKVGGLIAFHDVYVAYPGVSVVVGEALASGHWQLVGLTGTLATIQRTN